MKTRNWSTVISLAIIMCMTTFGLYAQQQSILDGVYIKENTPTRRVIPYTPIREADVMWSMRIWRTLNMREKINHPLFYPADEIKERKSLFQVLKYGIEEGTLTAYGEALFDDEFRKPLTKTEALKELGEWETIYREDDFGNMITDSVFTDVTSYDVKQYWIKEDWFFDRERSVMDVRIVGICPVQEKMEQDGITFKGYKPLFWIYFPEARYVFANFDVFNTYNDAERRTFEDIFWKRIFSSYIRKESNVYNRLVQDYKGTNIDMLLEAETIKTQIFNYEHDLWHY